MAEENTQKKRRPKPARVDYGHYKAEGGRVYHATLFTPFQSKKLAQVILRSTDPEYQEEWITDLHSKIQEEAESKGYDIETWNLDEKNSGKYKQI